MGTADPIQTVSTPAQSTGTQMNVVDNKVTKQEADNINSTFDFSVLNTNNYNIAQLEAALNSPQNDYVDPRSNDRFSKNFVSVSNPNKLQANIKNNIDTMVRYATSERGGNEYGNLSLRTLKDYQDLYPRFKVSSRPDPKTGYKTFTPYVFDLAQNTPLKENEINTFINSIAAPAIAQSMSA